MNITLNQEEIEQAIEGFVRNQISINPNQNISIELRAGRGENGYSATLDIRTSTKQSFHKTTYRGGEESKAPDETDEAPTKTSSKPRAVKPAPKRSITDTPEEREEVQTEETATDNTISETSQESSDESAPQTGDEPAEATVAEEPAKTEEKPEPRKGSIFSFQANKAAGA